MKRSFRFAVLAGLLSVSPGLFAAEPEREGKRPDHPRERAAWNAAFRVGPDGVVDGRRRLKALERACELPVDPAMRAASGSREALAAFPGLSWQALGPRPAQSYTGYGDAMGDVAGRVTALAIHPSNPSFVLAGAATGGIWKTTDGGATWKAVTDGAPAMAISAITFSPSNPNVIYAATGEADSADLEFKPSYSLGTYLGAGILRSVDQGETWTRIDTNLPPNSVVSRVLVHPTNPQLVLAGLYITQSVASNGYTPGGMWRSTDGGVTFVKTFSHAVSDLARDPNAPDVVYAAFGITLGCGDCSAASGVYRSADFGATFTPSLVSTTPGATFPNPTGNIKIGLTKTNPVTIYASVLDTNDEHTHGGVFRSTDAGATWSARANPPDMCGSQCSYDHFILPSPNAPDVVYAGAVDLYKSTNGGASWVNLSNVYSGPASIHPDQHAAAIHPGAPDTVWVGNDGGVYKSTDGLVSYTSMNGSLTLAQFNGIALSPTDPNDATGGTQDNGNLRFKGSLVWTDRTGGDGGFNLVKADNANVRLAANYYAWLNYSADGGETYANVTPFGTLMTLGGNAKEPMAFYPPAMAAPAAKGTVLLGTRRIWANTLFGSDANAWAPRSSAAVVNSSMTALDVLADGNGVIWAGTFSGAVLYSTDGGATFATRNAGLPTAIVSKVKAVTADGKSAYVTFGGFTGSLPSKHVFRTTDAGASWTNVSGDLPDIPVSAFAVDPGDPTDLFVGTDVGVFRSRDGGASWSTFNQGLPNVSVTDLQFHPATGDLWAATYGRGAFRIAASGSGGLAPTADFSFGPDYPAPGESVGFADLSSGAPTAWSWDFGDGATSAQKSPRHVYTIAGSYTVRLSVTNANGSSSKSKALVVVAGSVTPVTLQVPVVLDVFGVAPTHYTSDLVAVNRSGASTRVTVQYLPQPGTPGANGPRIGVGLDAGREWRVADVLAYLRANGYDLPASGTAQVGTLRLTFEDVSDPALVFAGSRTSTPNPNGGIGGSFGLFSAAPAASAAASGLVRITALREDSRFRSNLAIVDVPGGSGPAALSLQVYDGETGLAAGAPIAYTLQGGEWHQFGSILAGKGVSNGYVAISKTGGGSDRFLAYGVVNDGASSGGGTSDGSFVGTDAAEGLVPIVLSVNSSGILFTSELVLTNPGSSPATATLAYTPAALLGGSGGPYTGTVAVPAGRQVRIADAISYLRDTLHMPLPSGGNLGGTLQVSGALAYVRTSNPNPDASVGGTFGLAYPAVAPAVRAKTEAWVYGLVQDGATRSNLAIADARVGSSSPITYLVQVFDADSGSTTPVTSFSATLAGGQWYQFSGVLSGTGASHAYARVTPQGGASDFVVYGVLNDGAAPGQRTNDGSYVAMSGAM